MFKLNRSVVELLNKFFTDAYKVVGFVILASILLGLASYFALNIFYLTSTRWVAPVILSASYEKVIRLNGELAQYMYRHDKLTVERRQISAQLAYIDDALRAQEAFRSQLRAAMESEMQASRAELAEFRQLVGNFDETDKLGSDALEDYEDVSYKKLTEEFEANLIDRQTFVDGAYSLSQVENARLTRKARKIQIDSRRTQLAREVAALETALDGASPAELPAKPPAALTFEVVTMLREFRSSELESAKLRAERKTLEETVAMLDESIARYDRLQDEIKNSPYLRAMEEQVAIAFVPYTNLEDARAGSEIYGCSLGMLWCRQVGVVESVLEGEVTAQHPLYNEKVRGQMVELDLSDPSWAEEEALFTGGAPFLL
jgi:hypothetical protein